DKDNGRVRAVLRPLLPAKAKDAVASRAESGVNVHRPQVQCVAVEVIPKELVDACGVFWDVVKFWQRNRSLRLLLASIEKRFPAGRRDKYVRPWSPGSCSETSASAAGLATPFSRSRRRAGRPRRARDSRLGPLGPPSAVQQFVRSGRSGL